MRTDLPLEALDMAVTERRGDVACAIMHSERGTRYTAEIMKQACERRGLRRSMRGPGIFRDHAGAESLCSTFNDEHYYRHVFSYVTELVVAVDSCLHHRDA